jgi:glutamine amidotransferase
MIAVIDYKAGNLTSVVKALRYLDARDVVVTQSPEDVLRAEKIVLPGVGHFQCDAVVEGPGADRGGARGGCKGYAVSGDLCGAAVAV